MVLSILYGLLYVTLNAEDYALLIGSCVLFCALATTMFLTRKVDWYKSTPGVAQV
jgi:inner membrane protein